MVTAYQYKAEMPPLRTEPDGAIFVAQSRIPLETIIDAFNAGSSPEEIVEDFSALSLADTHAVISHYLGHKQAVDRYIQRRNKEAATTQKQIQTRFSSNALRDNIIERARSRGLRCFFDFLPTLISRSAQE